MSKVTMQELQKEEQRLKDRIEYETSVDARQTIKILEVELEIIQLAQRGLEASNGRS